MATDRIHRNARRGIAVAILGWLSVAAAAVVLAPPAGAAPAVTVPIRDLTPPVVSVDGGGTVTFVNEIQDKTVQVGGGGLLPTLVSVTAKTEVTLGLPSGQRVLAPGASVAETFASTCLTCSITYTYRLQSNASLTSVLTDAATKLLPPLPAPTPFVVNTLIPLPNLPGVNLPQLPPLTLPAPAAGGLLPTPPSAQPNTPTVPGAVAPPAAAPEQPAVEGVPGSQYTYSTGAGAAQLSPGTGSAAAAFDPARFLASRNATGSAGTGSGSGGLAGSYDGATVPVFGQLAGLNGSGLDAEGEALDTTADTASTATPLPAAALAAVVALAAAGAALVRTHQASRASS
ncbi:hypothetical protein SAMN05660748_4032 [Blastococcus aggregatus]|uniref:Uncharacterized protein n=1 Tax=Blastococcus aggregatus TaxID=38502 RepID=A0A285VDZ1_9ACTN|nr:hypothetical protein [Blastococcus aggregatus]SOC52329.1 hypothetical protein SAMN05660748_4032 [Blastococcus aggregatus]